MVARRLIPALLAFGLACLFLFAPVGINSFFTPDSVTAAPPLQGEPTPTPNPLPSPPPVPEVAVDLTADQPQIEAGESVTYTVVITNTTDEVVGDVVLSSTLPPSTTFVADPNSPIGYDAVAGAVIWNAGDVPADTILTATYQIQASITATDTFLLAEIEATSPDLTETLESWEINALGEPSPNEMWITPNGGELSSEEVPLTVIVPKEGLAEPLYFKVSESGVVSIPTTIWAAWDLTATNKNDDLISSFGVSLTLSIDLDQFLTQTEAITTAPSIYWLNETTDEWEALPSYTDWSQGRITALVDHFSTFGLGMSPPSGSYGAQHLPTIHGFSHNEWSGNSSVSYPFILPPAPGNMPFGLGLSYSSEGVNSLFSSASDIYGSELPRYRRQASTIGWGWSLTGLGSITRNLSGDNGAMYLGFSNGSFEMKPDAGASTWWHTEPQSFIKIKANHAERRYASKWEVFTQDGTRYTFGSDNWGNGVAFNMNTEGICPLPDRVLREAHLTEIRDASGNVIKITYATEGRRWHNGCDGDYNNNNLDYNYVRAIRPTEILFIPTGQTQATVKITLSYSSGWRLDGANVVESSSSVDVYSQTTWSEQNLHQVLVQIWGDPANGTGSWTTFRRYGLHQNQHDNYDNGEPLLVLRGIYDYGAITSGGTPLPGYTFEYSRLNGGWRNTNVLRWAHNGQGGKTYYNYAWRSGLPITGCGSATAGRYMVDYIEVHDGMNNKSTTKFTHNSPFVAGSRYDPDLGQWCTQGFEFGGWGHVVRELKQNVTDSASLQRTETWYYQREGNEVGVHAGLMQRQSHYNPQTLQEFERVSTTYSIEIPSLYSPSSTKWVKKTSEVHKTFNFLDTNQPTIRITTTYEYSTTYQGGFQWGHPTHVRQFAHGAATPTRTTVTNYYGAWINGRFVIQPFESTLLAGSSCLSHTRMYHDGSNAHGTYGTPLRGLVTKTSVATVACYGSNWSNTTYSYDGWGNLRYVVDPRGKQTETRYDTTDNISNPLPRLFAYPISTYNHLGQSVTLNWDERVGQVKQTTDPNNQSTHYKYDDFGRLKLMWAFGNSEAEPTQKYYYWNYVNSTQPYRVGVEQSTNSGAPYTTTFGVMFYDGLGRTLQSQSPIYVDGVARTSVDRALYNVQGLVASAYAPISTTATTVITNATFVNSGFTYATTTEYDSLGRVTKVTAPDGTFTSHWYDTAGVYTRYSIIDANRHRMEYYSDSLGRLAQVKELTGNCGTFSSGYDCNTAPYTTTWATYATTLYTYDIADRLTGVEDELGNITTITYDVAGRKTGMIDPDMGAWGYFYDDAGNMVRQRDPRGQRICYFYDDLNRLRGKQYRNDDNCPISLPSFGANVTLYEYDAYDTANGQYGRGMRTRMVDQTGTTQWWYDQRGRVSKETKAIEVNANTYTFTSRYEYDTMNRVTKMWYPSNTSGGTESTPLTYAYQSVSEQLQSATLTSGSSSLSANDIHYNHYGQIQRMDYGSTPEVRQEYAYWDLNKLHGLGRLRSVQAGRIGISTTEAQWMAYRDPFDTTYNTPGYDAVGNVLAIVDKNAGGSAPSHQYQVYEYDHLNRMVRAEVAGGTTGTWGAQKFVYDAIGNLDEVRDANTNIMQKNYTYNSTQPHAVDLVTSGAYSYGYGYDAAGNMTNRDGQELYYDAENRLQYVGPPESLNAIASYYYDGDGNRVRNNSNNTNTLYVSNHTEYDTATGKFTNYYYAGTGRFAMREHTAGQWGAVYYLLSDHLGSSSIVLSSSGVKWGEYRYGPWGQERSGTGGILPTDRRYTGQILDNETGLYFYNSRYYDPNLMRFIQADTIVPSLGNPQTLNRFSYVLNNPIKYTDPTGHEADAGEGEGCYTDWCWQNRWYRAHGYQWLNGGWSFTGSVYFSDVGIMREVLAEANITLAGSWDYVHGLEAAMGVWDLASKMVGELASVINPYEWLGQFLEGGVTLHAVGESPWHGCAIVGAACSFPSDGGHIYFPVPWKDLELGRQLVVHEIAHAMDWNSTPLFCSELGCRVGTMSMWLPYGGDISSYDLADNLRHEYFADAIGIWVYGEEYYQYENDISSEQTQFLKTFLTPKDIKGDLIPDA